jgi:hypothetical protein
MSHGVDHDHHMVAPSMKAPGQQFMIPAVQIAMQKMTQTVTIKQKFDLMEVITSCEAKNRYEVYQGDRAEGAVQLYLAEQSECCQRICCKQQRELNLYIHDGPNREAPQVAELHKPMHCKAFPCNICIRPELYVMDMQGGKIGRVHDPFVCANVMCCTIDQHIFDAEEKMKYKILGTVCQPGICCPCCFDVTFDIHDYHAGANGRVVGIVTKKALDLMEMCVKTNRFQIDFPPDAGTFEKILLTGGAFLLDIEYFEPGDK